MKNIQKPSLWLIIFLVGFPQISETIYTPSLPELTKFLSASDSDVQRTLSIYFIGFSIGVFFWGMLSDKIGRRNSMLYGIILYVIGSVACYLSKDVSFLILARFVQALGASVGSNVTLTILRDTYSDQERVAVFSKISSVLAFSPALGPIIGSLVAEFYGVSNVFLTLVVIGFIALVWSFFKLEETLDIKKTAKKTSIKEALKVIQADPLFWIYGGLIGVINGIIFSYYGEAPFIFIKLLNFEIIHYGLIGFVVAIACFLGAKYCKVWSAKLSVGRVLNRGVMITFLGGGLFLLVPYVFGSNLAIGIGLIAGIFIIMFGISLILPLCLSHALVNHKEHLGISGAFLGLYYYVLVGLITFGMSVLHTNSFSALPLYIIALTLVLFLLSRRLKQA